MVLDGEPSGDSQEDKEKSIQELKKEIKMLYDEISRLQEEIEKLKEEFKSVKFENTTKKTKFFTRFPDYATFLWALNFCLSVLPCSTVLSKGSIFLLIFMKVRLALLNQDLAYRFNISEGLVSRLVNEGLPALAFRLSFLVRWPSKKEVSRTLASLFKPRYSIFKVQGNNGLYRNIL